MNDVLAARVPFVIFRSPFSSSDLLNSRFRCLSHPLLVFRQYSNRSAKFRSRKHSRSHPPVTKITELFWRLEVNILGPAEKN
jgi:hypothetical protein